MKVKRIFVIILVLILVGCGGFSLLALAGVNMMGDQLDSAMENFQGTVTAIVNPANLSFASSTPIVIPAGPQVEGSVQPPNTEGVTNGGPTPTLALRGTLPAPILVTQMIAATQTFQSYSATMVQYGFLQQTAAKESDLMETRYYEEATLTATARKK